MQKYGFVTRQVDKDTNWAGLSDAVAQNIAISSVGYPFVTTDMIGGSLGSLPPSSELLVRWAQVAALMPIMYASTSPLGGQLNPWLDDPSNLGPGHKGIEAPSNYTSETIELYRKAIQLHERLSPYIIDLAHQSVATASPIVRAMFYEFPEIIDQVSTVRDQWMLGSDLLVAPLVQPGGVRNIVVPTGEWWDTAVHEWRVGPNVLNDYRAALSEIPVFIRKNSPHFDELKKAFEQVQ
jgi:alpha-glucosidase (family GH31 glycosyl hydrolase)